MGTTLDRETVRELTEPGIYFDDRLTGFAVRVRASAKGKLLKSWIVQYRVGSKQRRQKLGDVAKHGPEWARKKALVWLGKVEDGIDPAEEKETARTASAITLKKVIDQYLAMKERQLEDDTLRPTTVNNARLYLARGDYFKALHSKPIDAVTKKDVATRINAITLEHSSNTAKQARRFLSAFFTWAVKEAIADANPVIGTNDPPGSKPRERVLKDHELAAIWNACEDDDYGKIIKLLMLTGCRRREIGGLRWSEIDLEHENTMTIPGTRTKNKEVLELPITGLMRSIIESIPQKVDRDPLFGERAEGFTGWPHCRLDAGVRSWRIHDIRRSVATGMADLGIQPHIIEAILNHSSGSKAGVAGIYNRSTYAREMKNALAVWSDHVASITSGTKRKVVQFSTPR